MTKYLTLLKIASFVVPFVAAFLPIYSGIIDKPDIQVELTPTQIGNYSSAGIVIKNTGLEPATNVRITVNPASDMINYTLTFHTEDIEFQKTGPQNLIGKMARLANGQEVDFTTLLNSKDIGAYAIFVTHDKGSVTYYYFKGQQTSYTVFLLALLPAFVASIAAGISANVIIRKYQFKMQIGNNSIGFQGIFNGPVTVGHDFQTAGTGSSSEISKEQKPQSRPTASGPTHGTLPTGFKMVTPKSEPTPQVSNTQSIVNDQIRDIIRRIGKEKISNLLQEAKIIAIDTNDKEMQKWIEQELSGFVPPTGSKLTRNEVKEKGLIPDYRDIKGKFLIQWGEDINQEEMNYPILFGNSIKDIERTIELLRRGGKAYIPHTFPPSVKHLGGKSGDLELPLSELERIVNAVEQKLSKFLESKLS